MYLHALLDKAYKKSQSLKILVFTCYSEACVGLRGRGITFLVIFSNSATLFCLKFQKCLLNKETLDAAAFVLTVSLKCSKFIFRFEYLSIQVETKTMIINESKVCLHVSCKCCAHFGAKCALIG